MPINTRAAVLPRLLLLLWTLLAIGCAKAPVRMADDGGNWERLKDERHYQIQVQRGAIAAPPARLRLPEVRTAKDAHDAKVSVAQAQLVANQLARSTCLALAPYAEYAEDAGSRLRLAVRSIGRTNEGAAAASTVVGFFVPGPFRLPAGMGSLAVDAELRSDSVETPFEMRWARGANPLLHDAKWSEIGDAWQLAPSFGRDLRNALYDEDPSKSGLQASKQPKTVIEANRRLCRERFGTINVAAQGLSRVLPLAPEAYDGGGEDAGDAAKPADEAP